MRVARVFLRQENGPGRRLWRIGGWQGFGFDVRHSEVKPRPPPMHNLHLETDAGEVLASTLAFLWFWQTNSLF